MMMAPTSAAVMRMPVMVNSGRALVLIKAFQVACSNAAPRTNVIIAGVTATSQSKAHQSQLADSKLERTK